MVRRFTSFVGVDLGGARARPRRSLTSRPRGAGPRPGGLDALPRRALDRRQHPRLRRIPGRRPGGRDQRAPDPPACARCTVPACPGVEDCVDPAVVWLRTEGRALAEDAGVNAAAQGGPREVSVRRSLPQARARVMPYAHRATELVLCHERGLLPTSHVGGAVGLVAARADHLRRRLVRAGFSLHQNLLEVSPAGDPGGAVRSPPGPRLQARRRSVADPGRDPRAARRPGLRAAQPDGPRGRAVQRPLLRRAGRRVHRVPVGPRRVDPAAGRRSPTTAGSGRRRRATSDAATGCGPGASRDRRRRPTSYRR
jgi:hypothetical protein